MILVLGCPCTTVLSLLLCSRVFVVAAAVVTVIAVQVLSDLMDELTGGSNHMMPSVVAQSEKSQRDRLKAVLSVVNDILRVGEDEAGWSVCLSFPLLASRAHADLHSRFQYPTFVFIVMCTVKGWLLYFMVRALTVRFQCDPISHFVAQTCSRC